MTAIKSFSAEQERNKKYMEGVECGELKFVVWKCSLWSLVDTEVLKKFTLLLQKVQEK